MIITAMPITLTPEQEATLSSIPDEALREKVKQMLIDTQLTASSTVKSVRGKSQTIDPVRYAKGVIDLEKNLDTMLQLLVQSCISLYPEVVEKSKSRFEEKFKEFSNIDFLRIIYTVVNKEYGWGDRDFKGKLTNLYSTLSIVNKVEQDKDTEPQTSSLDELPVEPVESVEQETTGKQRKKTS